MHISQCVQRKDNKMYRVGETYTTSGGMSVLVLANDSEFFYGNNKCPIIGLVTVKGGKKATELCGYNEKGWYCGYAIKKNPSYAPYALQSDEPDEDELNIISGIREVIRNGAGDDIVLVKLLRQLRK